MLVVKTKLGISKIHGIGLFANQDISKGEKVWMFNPLIDIYISESELKKLSSASREQLFNYIYLDKDHEKYLLCGDDGRFFNHSDSPNCDDSTNDLTTAIRDIKKGEELTVNYKVFYGDIDEHLKLNQ